MHTVPGTVRYIFISFTDIYFVVNTNMLNLIFGSFQLGEFARQIWKF
jgi:hypothetical protein